MVDSVFLSMPAAVINAKSFNSSLSQHPVRRRTSKKKKKKSHIFLNLIIKTVLFNAFHPFSVEFFSVAKRGKEEQKECQAEMLKDKKPLRSRENEPNFANLRMTKLQ